METTSDEQLGQDLFALGRDGLPARWGELELWIAAELGFCYGVERAVTLADATRRRFPERRLFLLGAMIHNPAVNARLRAEGLTLLDGDDPHRLDVLGSDDVVLVPAFGAPREDLDHLAARGCLVVDTTCGSVMRVWKQVERWAREQWTVVLHGKPRHEETRATCSRIVAEGGRFLVVRDLPQAQRVADVIRGALPPRALDELVTVGAGGGFDARRHLGRLGLANQTTMLATETAAVGDLLREAMRSRHGATELQGRFAAQDTICSATQDRQDALRQLLETPLDLVLVVGGFDSSNTTQLARIAARVRPTFHVDGPACLLSPRAIRHRPAGGQGELVSLDWLPSGPLRVGLSAGASTPPAEVGAVARALAGLTSARGGRAHVTSRGQRPARTRSV